MTNQQRSTRSRELEYFGGKLMGHPEIREKCPNYVVKKTRMKIGIIKKYIFLSSELSLLFFFFFFSKFCLWPAGKTYTKPERSPWASGKTERTNFRHLELYRCDCISCECETTFAGQYGFLFFATGQAQTCCRPLLQTDPTQI